MGFTESIKTCLRKYFVFNGRARRSEFWWFYLFTVITGLVLGFVDGSMFTQSVDESSATIGFNFQFFSIDPANFMESPLANTFGYFVLIPTLSAAVRRFHDAGQTGWLLLLPLAPAGLLFLIGGMTGANAAVLGAAIFVVWALVLVVWIVLIIILAHDQGPGQNRYGPSSKYPDNAEVFD